MTDVADTHVGTLPGGTKVVAASITTGRSLLTKEDAFVKNQTRFDRQARLNLAYNVVHVSLDMYYDYVRNQVLKWSSSEIEALKRILESIQTKFNWLNLTLPNEVYLVKTSGLEEGYAAYTRQLDTIVLPANMAASLAWAPNWGDPFHSASTVTYLENVIIHECFHLFSKNNPERRYELYRLVHYLPTGNEIQLPNVS